MKAVVVFCLLLSLVAGIVFCFVPTEQLAALEKDMFYSMGLAGEPHLLSFEAPQSDTCGVSADEACVTFVGSVFHDLIGSASYLFEDDGADLEASIGEKIPAEGEIDYRGFAFEDRIPTLKEPLTDDETAYVFARIVSSATAKVPIDGKLAELSFEKDHDKLWAYARIDLGLKRLSQKYGIKGFPDSAVFSVWMSFSLKNSHISVDYDEISVCCETMDIPEALLIFGCNLAFGKKDYKVLFGNSVRNVFINARIYL